MKYSIVIPTLNEENLLPLLLGSLEKQSLKPQEIIIADADSIDRTRSIAKKFGCRIVQGGNINKGESIGKGRNNGVKASKTNVVFIIDADITIDDLDFFKDACEIFDKRKLSIATVYFKNQKQNKLFGRIFILTTNIKNIINSFTVKYFKTILGGSGGLFIVQKDKFLSLGGFDEKVASYEDTLFIKKVLKNNVSFGYIPLTIGVSGRRFDEKSLAELFRLNINLLIFKILSIFNKEKAEHFLKKYERARGKVGGDYD